MSNSLTQTIATVNEYFGEIIVTGYDFNCDAIVFSTTDGKFYIDEDTSEDSIAGLLINKIEDCFEY